MARKLALLLLLSLLHLPLVGCWSAREVNSLAFIMALGIDADAEGVRITVQVALPAGGGGGGGNGQGGERPVWVTSVSAPSVTAGIFNMPAILGREPFLGHLQVVVIGEDLAKQGIRMLLDCLARERQIRSTVRLAIAVGKAEDLLMVEPKVVQMPADYIFELLRQGERTGMIPPSEMLRTRIAWHNRPLMQIFLPLLQPQPSASGEGEGGGTAEQKPSEAILLKGAGVFLDDRMVGTLDTQENRGLAWLMGTISSTIVTIPRVEGDLIQHANFSSVRFKMQKEDGEARLTATVSQDGNLTQWPLADQGITVPLLKQFERDLVDVIQKEIKTSLEAIQKTYKSDVLGLGEQFRRLSPREFDALNWQEAFPNFVLAVEVRASFRRVGLTLR